jgi:hypothetical protein
LALLWRHDNFHMDSKKVAKQQDPSLTPHLTGEGDESEEDKEKIMTRAEEVNVGDDKKVPAVKVGEDKKVPAIEVPDDRLENDEDKKMPVILEVEKEKVCRTAKGVDENY